MFATRETVGLAEWIIDDTCLVSRNFKLIAISETWSLTFTIEILKFVHHI